MCWKKIVAWFKPDPIVPGPSGQKKRALLFGINNYIGSDNDLDGCLNDIDDIEAKLTKEFPDYFVTKFKDSQVTGSRFYAEIDNILKNCKAGDQLVIWYSGHGTQLPSNHEADGYDEALYFYDGPFSDDKLMELQQKTPAGMVVIMGLDSCFSGGMAKGNPKKVKSRFHQMYSVPIRHKRVKRLAKVDSRWVINAFCQEGQTSADAWFNGRANGAGTYYYLKSFNKDTTFEQAMTNIHKYLPSNNFDQNPILIGDNSLFLYKY